MNSYGSNPLFITGVVHRQDQGKSSKSGGTLWRAFCPEHAHVRIGVAHAQLRKQRDVPRRYHPERSARARDVSSLSNDMQN